MVAIAIGADLLDYVYRAIPNVCAKNATLLDFVVSGEILCPLIGLL